MTRDPVRWSDPTSEASPGLRALLDAASLDEPSAAQLERVAAGLPGLGSVPPPSGVELGAGSVVTTTSGAVTTGLGVGKLALVAAMLVAAAGAGGAWLASRTELARIRDLPAVEPASVERIDEDEVRYAVTHLIEPPPTPEPVGPVRARARRAEASAVAIESPSPPPLDEFAIVKAGHAALVVDPLRALALADEHRVRFGAGRFAEEREAIAIEALVRAARSSTARARLHEFVTAFPRSSYRSRLERLVADSP